MVNDGWNNFEREETDSSGLIRGERASFKAAGAEYVTIAESFSARATNSLCSR
jgi:hypothetical protein